MCFLYLYIEQDGLRKSSLPNRCLPRAGVDDKCHAEERSRGISREGAGAQFLGSTGLKSDSAENSWQANHIGDKNKLIRHSKSTLKHSSDTSESTF
jgi:hypothetical protein